MKCYSKIIWFVKSLGKVLSIFDVTELLKIIELITYEDESK